MPAQPHRLSSSCLALKRRSIRAALLAATALSASAFGADGTWITPGSGNYGDGFNWSSGVVAEGTGATGDFNSVDITSNATVNVEAPHTVGNLIFGDSDSSTPATWIMAAGVNGLTLAGTNPTITVNTGSANLTGTVIGASGITKQGVGTLDISGLTTPVTNITGGLNIAAGTVRIKGNSSISTVLPGGSVSGSGTLMIGNSSGNTASIDVDLSTFNGTLYSPAASTRWGTGSSAPSGAIEAGGLNTTFDLGAGGNLFYRNGTNSNITFQLGGLNGQAGSQVSGGHSAGGGNVTFQIGNKAGTYTFGGTIVDSSTKSAITKVGADSNQVLTGINTYTGATVINAGTITVADGGQITASSGITVNSGGALAVTGSGLVSNPKIAVNSGGTFDVSGANGGIGYTSQASVTFTGSGTVKGNYTHANGGTLSANTLGAAGTLTFANNLSINGGLTQFDLATPGSLGNGNDELEVGGNLDLSAGTFQFNFLTAPAAGNSYPLIHHAGSLTGDVNAITLNTGLRGTFSLTDASNILSLNINSIINGSANLTWTGNNGTAWDVNTTPNWASNGGPATFFQGDAVTFDDSTSNSAVAISASVQPALVTVNTNSTAYAFSGTGGIAGTAALVKSGTAQLSISTSNSYSGGTTLNDGTILVGNNNALGTGSVTLNGGTIDLQSSFAPQNQLNIPANKSATVHGGSGGGQVGIGTLTGSGSLNIDTTSGVFDLRNDVSGFSGTLTTGGGGSLRLNAGFATVNLANATLNLNTGLNVRTSSTSNVAIGALTGTGQLSGTGGGPTQAITYNIGALNQNTQFDGTIKDGANSVSVIKVGTGSLTLTGDNTYTGVTTVQAGALVLTGNAQNPVLTGGGADLQGGRLVLDESSLSQVQTILGTGYASNFATGQIHTSNTADPNKGIGYVDDTVAGKVTVAYTYYGDANLDKQVTASDFTAMSQHFGNTNLAGATPTWAEGDFNYDGKINALDFNAIATNFGAAALTDASLGTLVPEPTSLALLGLGALALRRRRK